ncbi:MAG: protein bem46 [Chlamydiota bacterium]|jgi:pimeloyl-ACP methyl ester carboxylesterase
MATVGSVSSQPFQASWNEQNASLQEAPARSLTLIQRVCKLAYFIFSIVCFPLGLVRLSGWIVSKIARHLFLPSGWFYRQILSLQMRREMQRNFQAFCGSISGTHTHTHFDVTTPDSSRVKATIFRHRFATDNTPTVLFCPSNASVREQLVFSPLVHKWIEKGIACNFVIFDYRGSGLGTDDAERPKRAEDLVIDADAVLQLIRDQLRTPDHQIHRYGWSLGGGVSANLGRIHPELTGSYVNERSFSSTSDVVRIWCKQRPLIKCFANYYSNCFKRAGWDLVSPPTVLNDRSIVVYHPGDALIPPSAGLARKVQNTERVRVLVSSAELAACGDKIDHHTELLENYEIDGENALEYIAHFMLQPPTEEISVI